MIYTAWGDKKGPAHTLTPGEGPPCFHDGTPMPGCERVVWTIRADSWEDACRHYEWLHGWSEKFKP
jgi:hypothetical protein